MTRTLSLLDRLRIERVVWMLDQRLYDLPRRSRIEKRREVRQNLLSAAADIGIADALRNLGDSRRLAAEYREAEFGDEPRPAWITLATFVLIGQLILTSILTEAALAFGDGIKAADPTATGAFTWEGIRYLQETVTYTFVNGQGSYVGGSWSPLAYVLWAVAAVLVGRVWRVIPQLRRRRTSAAAM